MSTLWFCVIIGFHGVYNSYSGHCPTGKEIVQYSFPSVHEDKLTIMYPWHTFLDSQYVDNITKGHVNETCLQLPLEFIKEKNSNQLLDLFDFKNFVLQKPDQHV